MPKVAQYGGPRVGTEIPNRPQATTAAGDIQFRAQQQLSSSIADLGGAAIEMKRRIDTTSAEEALVLFEREKNELLFNPEKGYFNTQGKNAYDNAELVTKSLEDLRVKYADTLGADARRMFDSSASAHIARTSTDVMRHASKGLKAWEVATLQAQTENSVENASLYWNRPDDLRIQNALGRQAIIDASEMEGVGPEATNERLQTFESSFAKQTITAALNSSAAEGQTMLDQYGDRLEGSLRQKMADQVARKVVLENQQSTAQQAVLRGTELVETYDTRKDILDAVNSIEDPELRKKTMGEAMRQFNLKKQAESEAQKDAFEFAEQHILGGGSAETLQSENPEAWEMLSAGQKQSILSGKSATTDWNVFSDLMIMDTQELAKVNPADYIHQLAPAERAKLITAVKAARGTATKSEKTEHQVGRTRTAQVNNALVQMLGKKSQWDDDTRRRADTIYDLLDSEATHRESIKGSALTSQEFTDLLSDLTRKATIERNVFGVDFLAPDVETDVTEIPAGELRAVSEYLREKGVHITYEKLIKAHRQATEN